MFFRLLTTYFMLGTTIIWAESISFWHSFTPPLSTHLALLVNDFEKMNPQVTINLEYKGNYDQIVDELLQTPQQSYPHILQLAEYHFHSFKMRTDLYLPLEQLLKGDFLNFTPYVKGFYQHGTNRFIALPFNISAGIMYVNWTAWKAAGMGENDIPQTWDELISTLSYLHSKGLGGLSTGWPVAYIFEHYAAQIGLPLVWHDQLTISHPSFISRLEAFMQLAKSGSYIYGGQYSNSENLFTNETVTLFFQGACRFEKISLDSPFEIRTFSLPLGHTTETYALNIGGASLWALSHSNLAQYQAVGQFFNYLLDPQTQTKWYQSTHYLPTTQDGLRHILNTPLLQKTPGFTALEQVMRQRSVASDGVCLDGYASIRKQISVAIETALSGNITAFQALHQVQAELQ